MHKVSSLLAAATVFAAPAFAQGGDECTGATPLMLGVAEAFDTTTATDSPELWPCAGTGGADLWYSYVTTGGPGLVVSAETCGSTYDTAVEIFSGSCGSLTSVICNDDACGLQSTALAPIGSAGQTFFIRVGGFNAAAGIGTIVINEVVDPCPPDMFEDSDDCASAVALGDGLYTGLNANSDDNDYYEVGLDAGATITVDIFFVDDNGDMDLYLWDPMVSCDTNVAGQGTATGALAVGFSTTDDEQVVYTNPTASPMTLIVEVDTFGTNPCNDYDLMISGSNGMGGNNPIGTNYCMANANSTGMTGLIEAFGSRVVANNDVTLTASQLPTSAFGFFITSTTTGFVPMPNGSAGNLCLGGAIGRYVGAGQIQSTGAGNEFSLVLDLTQTPSPTGFVSVMMGETRSYQAWHRDSVMGMTTSNFTDGTTVMFQ